jgi:hypothetical protein
MFEPQRSAPNSTLALAFGWSRILFPYSNESTCVFQQKILKLGELTRDFVEYMVHVLLYSSNTFLSLISASGVSGSCTIGFSISVVERPNPKKIHANRKHGFKPFVIYAAKGKRSCVTLMRETRIQKLHSFRRLILLSRRE